jgi:cyclopropane fatty-acyl-phospholipid synthase-like methyltransferase
MEPLHKRGFDVQGIEISEDVVEYLPESLNARVEIGDFSEARGNYDLVCCVEVAEHIDPSRSQELISKLCTLSDQYIYFTAAPPGQGGHGHINCRPHSEWIQWFNQSGYQVSPSVTEEIRSDLGEVDYTYWLRENSFVLSYD